MMTITVCYETQLKRALGTPTETVEVPERAGASDVVRAVAERHGEAIAGHLLDADGNVRNSVLMFVGDEQVTGDASAPLSEGDTLTLMSPISGG